jgi:hypothetical protein
LSASVSRAPEPSAVISRTSPTTTPRTLTSACRCISLPTDPVRSVTIVASVNFFW